MNKSVIYNGEMIKVLHQTKKFTVLDIRRWHVEKGFLFLLSVVTYPLGIAAMWSTHDISGFNNGLTFADAKKIFKKDHIKQIKKIIAEEIEREPAEFKIPSIHDLTKKACS